MSPGLRLMRFRRPHQIGALLVVPLMTAFISCGGDVNSPFKPSPIAGSAHDGFGHSSGVMLSGSPPAAGATRIAPSTGAAQGEFTIIDAPCGRLTAGAVALFAPDPPGRPILYAPLRTNRPYMSAQGMLPSDLAAGTDYLVTVTADGQTFNVGSFHASRITLEWPVMTPSQAPPGTDFTIDDPEKRMRVGDDAVFYLPGTNPLTGTPADRRGGTYISPDGLVLNGLVPQLSAGLQYYVAVVSLSTGEIRFQGLGLFVSAP